jgi:hypothetical protein
VQNSYYHVKIGFWILTTNFTKTALIFDLLSYLILKNKKRP